MHAAEELVDGLDHRALAGSLADMEHLIAERVENGPRGARTYRCGAAAMMVSVAPSRADHAARHGRIDETPSSRQHARRNFLRPRRADRSPSARRSPFGGKRLERAAREQDRPPPARRSRPSARERRPRAPPRPPEAARVPPACAERIDAPRTHVEAADRKAAPRRGFRPWAGPWLRDRRIRPSSSRTAFSVTASL